MRSFLGVGLFLAFASSSIGVAQTIPALAPARGESRAGSTADIDRTVPGKAVIEYVDEDANERSTASVPGGLPTPVEDSYIFATEQPVRPATISPTEMAECCAIDGGTSDPNMPAKLKKIPLAARWGNGFELYTQDEEYSIQFHNLTQFDYRDYGEDFGPLDPQNTFVFPREWLIMNGKLTKPIDYYLSFAFGFNAVNILDVFFNWHVVDDRLQIKLGRYKTPFTYEFFGLPIYGLVNPERSLYFNNFGLNRDLGVMAWGTIFDKRMDYAVGVFNGTRNGFVDENNDNKDFVSYLNFKPFVNNDGGLFQYLNVGVSTDIGNQEDVIASPRTFRTLVPVTGVNTLGVPFFNFASNVRDYGPRQLWSTHAAWYHQSLSLIGEWQTGFEDYARTNSSVRTNVSIDSFYVQAGYFLTGETVTGRGMVQPIRPFDIRKGFRGIGAWEAFGRYDDLNIDPIVLSLSDGKPWTNNVQTISVGTNWYWSPVIKFVLEYTHAVFGNEVFVTPTQTQKSNDAILLRSQIYF